MAAKKSKSAKPQTIKIHDPKGAPTAGKHGGKMKMPSGKSPPQAHRKSAPSAPRSIPSSLGKLGSGLGKKNMK